MFSLPQARAAKLRLNEINHKIVYITKVINNVTGSGQSYLNRKLLTVKLKKLKLQALSAFAKTQEMNTLLSEIDSLVVENELCAEIDSIKNSEQFQRSEKFMLKRKYGETRDSHTMTTDYSALSTPTGITYAMPHAHETPESTRDSVSEADLFDCYHKMVEKVSMLVKSTNTEPVELQPELENMATLKRDVMKLVQSTFHEETNEDHTETNIPETKAEVSTSNTTKKENKKKSRESKRHKSREVNDFATAAPIDLDECISIDVTGEDATKDDTIDDFLETSHDNIANLLKTYEKIDSPEISTTDNVESPQSLDLHTSDSINNNEGAIQYLEKSHEGIENVKNVNIEVTNLAKMPQSKSYSQTTQKSYSSKESRSSSKGSRNIKDSRDHKSTKSKHSTMKRRHETDKEKKTHSSKRVKKTHHSEKITKDTPKQQATSSYSEKDFVPQLISDLGNDLCEGSHLNLLTESIKRSMVGTAIKICHQEEMVKTLWQNYRAAKQARLELSSSLERTFNCTQCGQDVSEDHMSMWTVTESPEC